MKGVGLRCVYYKSFCINDDANCEEIESIGYDLQTKQEFCENLKDVGTWTYVQGHFVQEQVHVKIMMYLKYLIKQVLVHFQRINIQKVVHLLIIKIVFLLEIVLIMIVLYNGIQAHNKTQKKFNANQQNQFKVILVQKIFIVNVEHKFVVIMIQMLLIVLIMLHNVYIINHNVQTQQHVQHKYILEEMIKREKIV
ncbi:unnamed protein product [Paramecium sonneborni]|uniref:Transmembrane protein n=1 Tax=Paramecium sonneborni TaxID=65129 RepID=A0A8S1RS73_9CILI|nr:unnamed protein product [Paramecium sonneborni]